MQSPTRDGADATPSITHEDDQVDDRSCADGTAAAVSGEATETIYARPPLPHIATAAEPEPEPEYVPDARSKNTGDENPGIARPSQPQIDPELVRRITEQVIRSLTETGFSSEAQTSVPEHGVDSSAADSTAERSSLSAQQSSSSDPIGKKDFSRLYHATVTDVPELEEAITSDRDHSDRSRKSVSPEPSARDGLSGLRRTSSRPYSSSGDAHPALQSPKERRRASREDSTTLEKIWGPLFDQSTGKPTIRLSQFLRGLALHIIINYEPKGSVVIPPPKMLRFFTKYGFPDEAYPWHIIFGGRMSDASLSLMYRKLSCQHHFIQSRPHEAPTIPALTPAGFEVFVTLLIQAHPEQEFARLNAAVTDLPISNADDRSERYPKELSRRLLPDVGNTQAEQRLISSLNHETSLIQLKGAKKMPPPPPPPTSFSATSHSSGSQNPPSPTRERTTNLLSSQANAIYSDDLVEAPAAFERERQPYSSKEGGGRVYDKDGDLPVSTPNISQHRMDSSSRIQSGQRRRSTHGLVQYTTGALSNNPNNQRSSDRHRSSTEIRSGQYFPPTGPGQNDQVFPLHRDSFSRHDGRPSISSASGRDYYGDDADGDYHIRHMSPRAPPRRSEYDGGRGADDPNFNRNYPLPPRKPQRRYTGAENTNEYDGIETQLPGS